MNLARLLAAGLSLLVLVATGCSTSGPSVPSKSSLEVLAGSELKDMTPILNDMANATGWRLHMNYVGSLDGATEIASGTRADMAWFSTAKYLQLLPGGQQRIVAAQTVMLSPVVMGVKHSLAQRFGWAGNPNVTWADIQARSKSGQLRFGMTNPTASNSGFVALVGVAEALSASGAALDAGTINVAGLKDFFAGQALTAGSSGFLADSYVRQQDSLDGMINYESVLLTLNQGSQLHEKLDLVYPKEGIATADYPMLLLNRAHRDAFDKMTAYLRQPAVQTRIMTTAFRRPGVPEVKPDSRFPSALLIELPFPSSLDVVNKLLFAYLDQIRKPSHAYFVLDTSGSMEGSRLNGLKQAFLNLTGADTSITGQFAQFRQREEITIILFNGRPYDHRDFTVNDISPGSSDLAAIRTYVNQIVASDGTAIYDSVYLAYQLAATAMKTAPDRYYSIVLMTDGQNNTGRDGPRFINDYKALPPEVQAIKTFPILFGEGSPAELTQVAQTTGGTTFDSRSTSLASIFKQIRGYQ